jgi:crotonobetainyl-CoA:carnitine CoA-transferase CaiB-like acyl-CoA transferase
MDSTPEPKGCLGGLRILDLSRVLAGPWATQMLGDLGADVIKIERPAAGDDTRHWGPPFDAGSGDAAYFLCANRNKRSMAIDFATPEGASLLRRLLIDCDVVVENFKPGTLERYGLGPHQLLEVKPSLVVCSISGFGHTGPLKDRAGYDLVVQALGGLMSVTGPEADEPGSRAYKCGVAVTDLFTGLHAVVAILAAIRHRDQHGEGQHIDMALFDCQLAMLANLGSQWLIGEQAPERLGNAHPSIAPYESFPCADGDMVIAVGNDSQFRRCCEALGQPDWALDPRFTSNALRVANRQALRLLFRNVLSRDDRQHWLQRLDHAGVPASAVQSVPEALDHPQAAAREMLKPLDPTKADSPCLVGSPLKLGKTPTSQRRRPPALGEHTAELLSALGVSEEEAIKLWQTGVVGLRQPPPGLGMDETP